MHTHSLLKPFGKLRYVAQAGEPAHTSQLVHCILDIIVLLKSTRVCPNTQHPYNQSKAHAEVSQTALRNCKKVGKSHP